MDRTECTPADANLNRDRAEIIFDNVVQSQTTACITSWLKHRTAISKWSGTVFASFFISGGKNKVQDSNEALSEKQAKQLDKV